MCILNFYKRFNNFFERKLGWFFINGRKSKYWEKYINSKK